MFLTIKEDFWNWKKEVVAELERATGKKVVFVEGKENVVEIPDVGEDQQFEFVEKAIGNFYFKHKGRQVGYGFVFQPR